MCGRFTIAVPLEELLEMFEIERSQAVYVPRYNAAPGQMICAVVEHEGKRVLGQLKWGLIPSWAKDEKIGYKMINAKAETVREKPSFAAAFERRRCLIPADGFFEWQRADGGKQPMRIVMKRRRLFAMAGLYDTWIAPDGRKVGSCAIITTAPNELMRDIHDRMPVILQPGDEALWLNRSVREPERLLPLLLPFPAEEMEAYRVHPRVGSVKNDDPACIEVFSE